MEDIQFRHQGLVIATIPSLKNSKSHCPEKPQSLSFAPTSAMHVRQICKIIIPIQKLRITVKSVMTVSDLLLDSSSVSRVKSTTCRQLWVYLCRLVFSCCRLFVLLCQKCGDCFSEDRAHVSHTGSGVSTSSSPPTRVALDVLILLWYSRCPAVVSL